MKKLFQILALSALVATIWLPALAQNTQPQTTTTAQAGQGDEEAKAALYQKFLDLYKKDPKAANEVAKEYLQKYPAESEQTAYLKKWSTAYLNKEKNDRKTAVQDLLKQQKYAEAFGAAKAILAQEPDDVNTLTNAVFAALYASWINKNEGFNVEAANYARKAVQLIQNSQLDKKDETLGWLNSALGFFSLKSNPNEAINFYIKAAQLESPVKKDPQTYLFLVDAYRDAQYKQLASDIKTRCSTGEQQATPDCKALSDRVNQVVDRMIDAYARAIALATDPKYATLKADAMKDLTPLYKFRHNDSEAGLNEFIAGVLAKPLPTQPIGTGTASTTPATSQTSTAGTAATPVTPTTTTTTTTGTNPAPKTTTPASTTTNGKTPRRR